MIECCTSLPSRIECLGNWYLIGPLLVTSIVIAISYYIIPFRMMWVIRHRKEKTSKNEVTVYVMFAAFIFSCGTGHVLDAAITWFGSLYWIKMFVDGGTAVLSLLTAMAFIQLTKRRTKKS